MGLDSFWKLPGEVKAGENKKAHEALFSRHKKGLNICGGMFSGHGVQSFRGKVYAGFIDWLLEDDGVLYQEEVSSEQVKEIADKIDALATDISWKELQKIVSVAETFQTKKEFDDFRIMFRRYADAGATLLGWW